jgi:predicted DNA-binding transcriptional regulator AlpA
MPSHNANQNYSYLDAQEVAELLGLSMRTVVTRAKHRPWLLPPRVEVYDRELLRWRQDVVRNWLTAVTKDAEREQTKVESRK